MTWPGCLTVRGTLLQGNSYNADVHFQPSSLCFLYWIGLKNTELTIVGYLYEKRNRSIPLPDIGSLLFMFSV